MFKVQANVPRNNEIRRFFFKVYTNIRARVRDVEQKDKADHKWYIIFSTSLGSRTRWPW